MGHLLKILLKKKLIAKLSNCYIVTRKTKQFNSLTMKQFTSGFTLIELLVVIAVVGILVTGLAIAVNPVAQLQKSRDAKRIEALKQIKTALELYYQDYGRYPATTGATSYQMVDAGTGLPVAWGSAWSSYMPTIPTDPTTGKTFRYWADGTQQTFALYANLDRAENTCIGVQTTACPNAAARVGSATGVPGAYNYGVTSGNASP